MRYKDRMRMEVAQDFVQWRTSVIAAVIGFCYHSLRCSSSILTLYMDSGLCKSVILECESCDSFIRELLSDAVVSTGNKMGSSS